MKTRNVILWVLGAVGVFCLPAVAFFCLCLYASFLPMPTPKSGAPVSSRIESLRAGETARLLVPGQSAAWVCVDQDALNEMLRFSRQDNERGIRLMMLQGRLLVVAAETRASVLEPGFMTCRVRILEGLHSGKTGLIASEHVKR